jgi:hypothetical protein
VARTVEDYLNLSVYGRSAWELERAGVDLVRTACQLGGSRPWLVCPDCGRRCGVLYTSTSCVERLPAGSACGWSTRAPARPGSIGSYAAHRFLRHRLGGSTNLFNPPPGKPPRMHWRRFSRESRKLAEVERRFDLSVRAWCTRMESWLDRKIPSET